MTTRIMFIHDESCCCRRNEEERLLARKTIIYSLLCSDPLLLFTVDGTKSTHVDQKVGRNQINFPVSQLQ